VVLFVWMVLDADGRWQTDPGSMRDVRQDKRTRSYIAYLIVCTSIFRSMIFGSEVFLNNLLFLLARSEATS